MKDNKIADRFRNDGNLLYQQNKIFKAVLAYNMSLCYSEPGSKQLALAYGNRSAVYLQVGLFDECLENIELARENNHPDPAKLKIREEKCLEARETKSKQPEDDPAELIKLSYEPNKKIPFIVDCLELRANEKFGRHIITTRDLNPGDIIAIEEPALKMLDSLLIRYSRCIGCLKRKMLSLFPCDGCVYSKLFNSKTSI
jgi:SET and MYND domain-containing protein 4